MSKKNKQPLQKNFDAGFQGKGTNEKSWKTPKFPLKIKYKK